VTLHFCHVHVSGRDRIDRSCEWVEFSPLVCRCFCNESSVEHCRGPVSGIP